MSHRREQKENLRREREERERKTREARQRKQLVGYVSAGAIVLVAVVVLVVFVLGGDSTGSGPGGEGNLFPEGSEVAEQQEFDVAAAARAANCELETAKGAGTQDHTSSLEERVDYSTNPPTSGRHFIQPAADGVYQGSPPQDEELVHALEHGRVVVWVKPGSSEGTREQIRAVFDEDEGYQTLLVQRKNMPYEVAATAWNGDPAPNGTGRMLTCRTWTPEAVDALRAFRDEHRSRGPEPVP